MEILKLCETFTAAKFVTSKTYSSIVGYSLEIVRKYY